MNTRVILVRHGESTSNLQGLVQGRGHRHEPALQSSLTEKGILQATRAGQALRNIPIDRVFVSPLKRAQQTAEAILQNFDAKPPLQSEEGLCEVALPDWEGMSFAEIQSSNPDGFYSWHNTPDRLFLSGRYPILDLFEQAQEFWHKILPTYQGQTLLLVAHSGINRALMATRLGITAARYHGMSQTNGAISILNIKPDGTTQLESLNLSQHQNQILPPLRSGWHGPRFLLVRHGETDWNRDKRFQGQIDIPLNNRGMEQAAKAALFLQSITIDRAFTSPLLRPKQTALAILKNRSQELPLELIDDLKEISHGLWEGKFESEIEAEFPGELQRWQSMPELVQMPEGENLQQVWLRVQDSWKTIVQTSQPGETVLVVAHDAVNKALLCQLFNLSPQAFWAFKQGNGGVSVIDYQNGITSLPVLISCNITSHLSDSVLDTTAAGAL